MELEKQIDGLTVTIEGRAGTELVFAGHGEYPDEWEAYWIDEPRIVDVHNNYYDVNLTEEEEKEHSIQDSTETAQENESEENVDEALNNIMSGMFDDE